MKTTRSCDYCGRKTSKRLLHSDDFGFFPCDSEQCQWMSTEAETDDPWAEWAAHNDARDAQELNQIADFLGIATEPRA